MKAFKTYIMATFLPIVFISSPVKKPVEHTLHGVVALKETGKPVPDVFLYTVKGEDEAITDKKGEFRFVTWQKLPVVLYVRNKEDENIRIVVTDPSEYIRVKL